MADKSDHLASAWSELPQEVVSNIERRLDSAVDMSSLRSVCKNWHSSRKPNNVSILSPFLPKMVSNVKLPFVDCQNEPVILVARAVFLVRQLGCSSASRGWLLTVEEMVPGKLRILYPLSIDYVEHLPSNHPKYLDLSKFDVTQIAKTYGFKYTSDGKDVTGVRRVVMCSASTVMVLYGEGTVIGIKLKSGFWSYVRESLLSSFLDVTSYRGNHVRAVDFSGNVHIIDHEATKVVKTISPNTVFNGSARIFIFESDSSLLAVACDPKNKFVIYRLDEEKNQWIISHLWRLYCWKVLFISSHWSFFIKSSVLDLRSRSTVQNNSYASVDQKSLITEVYVIYSKNSFSTKSLAQCCTSRLYMGASIDLDISVFFSDSDNLSFWKKYVRSRTMEVLWPPPAWFWTDPDSSSREDEDAVVIVENSVAATIQNLNGNSSTTTVFKGVNINSELVSTAQKIWENMSFWKQYFHRITIELLWRPPTWFWIDPHSTSREDEELDGHRQNGAVFQTQIMAVENSDAATIQNLNRNSSTTEFKGVNINSNLVSTLQKIWEKYGDLMEQITFRNADIIARALESLATAVIILQSNTGNSLNKDHADYLNSTLCDLQQMKFKVDWLVPFVENAIAVQKSKPLIDSMNDFDKAKAVGEEMKQKVFEEVAKLDQVEEDMALVYERLPVLKSMDFNQSLGDGLC